MQGRGKRAAVALGLAGALAIGVSIALVSGEGVESWEPATEGFLAVAGANGSEVALWDTLESTALDDRQLRPASAWEAVQWLNAWPYRDPDHQDRRTGEPLEIAAQNREVRCIGAPTGSEIPHEGNDADTLAALHFRKECTYAKWKIWSGETAERLLNERHIVWVSEDGLFHARVDYWK